MFTLVYVPAGLLSDRLFTREVFGAYRRLEGKSVLVHAPRAGATPEQEAFLSKRISAQLSENLVPNLAFEGHRRTLLRRTPEGAVVVRTEVLTTLFQTVECVVLTLTAASDTTAPTLLDPADALPALVWQGQPRQTLFFPSFAQSALTAVSRPAIETELDYARLAQAFPEEEAQLRLGWLCHPVRFVNAATLPVPA
jgi:hypothetical protein